MTVKRRNYNSEGRRKDQEQAGSGDAVWAYEFTHRKYRYRQSGFSTKRAAEMAEAKAKEEAMIGGLAPKSYNDIAFSKLVDQFFSERHLTHAPSTVESEWPKGRTLQRFYGNTPVSKISVADVKNFRNTRLAQGIARRTANLELILLRCIFGHAIDGGHGRENPAKQIKLLKLDKTEKVIPSALDFNRLLEAAKQTTVGGQLVVWCWLSALSGLRHTESFYLEWTDIDFEKSLIYVRQKEGSTLKTRAWRLVDLHPQLMPILKAWKSEWEAFFAKRGPVPPHNWVFYNPRRPAFRCQTFRKAFETACERAGLVGVTMNSMRHFFISIALMSGVAAKTISVWAGHANTMMVDEVYTHLKDTFKQEQMAKVRIEAAG